MESSVCLICDCNLDDSRNIEGIDNDQIFEHNHHQTDCEFTLRTLLEIPKERSKLEQNEGICDTSGSWVGLCNECKKCVKEAKAIYEELVEMVKRFSRKQKEIVERIRNCDDSLERRAVAGKRRKRGKFGRNDYCTKLNATNEARKFVRGHNYQKFESLVIEKLDDPDTAFSKITNETGQLVKEEIDKDDISLLSDAEFDDFVNTHQPLEELAAIVKQEEIFEDENPHSVPNNEDENSDEKESEWCETDRSEGNDSDSSDVLSDIDGDELAENSLHCEEKEQGTPANKNQTSRTKKSEKNETSRKAKFCVLYKRNNYRDGRYHCLEKNCSKSYSNCYDLHDHISFHTGKPAYSCKICSEKYFTPVQLRRHVTRIHKTPPVNTFCELCQKNFKSKKSFDKHMKKHEDEEKKEVEMNIETNSIKVNYLYCHICNKRCKASGLKKHILSTHHIRMGRRNYPCTEEGCDKVYTKRLDMEGHRAKVHLQEHVLKCETCGEGFFKRSMMIRHQQLKHLNENFVCELCGALFRCADYLHTHRSSVHNSSKKQKQSKPVTQLNETPSICNHCGKSFKFLHTLTQHIQYVHENKFPVSCDLCGQGVRGPSHLKMHMYFHHRIGEKPETNSYRKGELHQCLVVGCKRRFFGKNGKSKLEEHAIQEHGETGSQKKYKCGVCGNEFCDKYKFQQHEMTHENKESRPFKCDICGKGFTNNTNLRYHEVFTHKVEKKFVRPKKVVKDKDNHGDEVIPGE